MNRTRCSGTGFLNHDQMPPEVADEGVEAVQEWLKTQDGEASDVTMCDCCGDGAAWYGEPGQHYTANDPSGMRGPYAYNGGLCECH